MNKKTFLVADDDDQFRLLMEEILIKIFTDEAIKVLHASNGTEAINIFEKYLNSNSPIDVVITDYAMPEATGSDVIISIINKKPTPIVVVSAVPEAHDHDFIQEGAIYFLPKPFDISTARNVMDAAIAMKIDQSDIDKATDAIDRLKSLDV